MVCGKLFAVGRDVAASPLRTHDNLVFGPLVVFHGDDGIAEFRGLNSSLAMLWITVQWRISRIELGADSLYHIRKISPREARCPSCKDPHVDIWCRFDAFHVMLQDVDTAPDIWEWHSHFSIETTRPYQCPVWVSVAPKRERSEGTNLSRL